MKNFWDSVKDKSSQERATDLENNTGFQEVHKTYASQGQSSEAQTQSDVKHHFVAYVISDGKLIELDGTKKGPLVVEEGTDDVLRASIKEIQRKLQDGEISETMSMMTLNAAQ